MTILNDINITNILTIQIQKMLKLTDTCLKTHIGNDICIGKNICISKNICNRNNISIGKNVSIG